MSLNLCADVLLLHLARPEQIASLTFLAATSPLSPVHDLAAGLPINHGSAEEVIALQPDLVLVHRYSNTHLVNALEDLGFRLWEVESPDSLESAAAQMEALALVLGNPERGKQLAGQLRQLPAGSEPASNTSPVVAVYGPNGMTTGAGSLLHDLIQRTGLRNFASQQQLPATGRIPLETLLMHPPRALVLSGEKQQQGSTLAEQTLQHPALRQMAGTLPTAHIPGRYWSCGGPEILEAGQRLRQLRTQLTAEGAP